MPTLPSPDGRSSNNPDRQDAQDTGSGIEPSEAGCGVRSQWPSAEDIAAFKQKLPEFSPVFIAEVRDWMQNGPHGADAVEFVSIPEKGIFKVCVFYRDIAAQPSIHGAFCDLEQSWTVRFPQITVEWMTFDSRSEIGELQKKAFLADAGATGTRITK